MIYILLITLLLIALLVLKKNNKKFGYVTGFAGVMVAIITYYICVPILSFFFKEDFFSLNLYGFDFVVMHYYIVFDENVYRYILSVVTGIIAFCLGYYLNFLSKKNRKKVSIEFTLAFQKRIYNFALGSLIIGGAFLITFVISVGGVNNALSLAEITRGFENSVANISYIGGIAKLLSRIIIISPVLFYMLIILQKNSSIKMQMLLGISLFGSIFYFLMYAGRTPLITFLLIFISILFYKYFNKVWLKLIVIGIFALPILDIFSNIFLYFSTQEWRDIEISYANYFRQFVTPTMVLLNSESIVNVYNYNFFKNYFTDIISLLPKIGYPASYVNTSEFFRGSNWRLHGGIPNDLFSYGYFQFGFLGIIIHSSLFGYFVGLIDYRIALVKSFQVKRFLGIVLATQIFQVVFSNDLGQVIQTHFLIWTIILLIFISKKTVSMER